MTSVQGIYPQAFFFPREFEDIMDTSPPSPEDPELVPILDREDNSDLSRPDSSISSYSSWSSTDSLCLPPYIPTSQKYPPPPPPTPFLTSPLVSPLKHGLEDDRDLYSSPFVLSASLLELGETLGDLFVESDGEYRDMGESVYIPYRHNRKHLSGSWSLPCSFNGPTNYPAPNVEAYDSEDYCIPVRSSFDEELFESRRAPYTRTANFAINQTPDTPPPSRCSGDSEERPWPLSEIEKRLQVLADERARAEESRGQDGLGVLERPPRRSHGGGAMKKFSRAWRGYLHRS
ncbi:hypothetical protein C7212DRAFT_367082 [Tuber magnatum]|uniref:Uncharacterized protein n=1 Tax=Tuber magnatum TaxID=42249 RepID=A0A317SFE2_9PEZI|nr:hypothetical protein C7212DRAFT_367082 [Tuber magnatum]